MASVNLFSLFAFICLALTLDGASAQNISFGNLVSVRVNPTELHRCMGSIMTSKFILTTAACLECDDECDLFIILVDRKLVDPRKDPHNIKQVFIHPQYHINPREYDIGLAELYNEIPANYIFRLPEPNGQIHNIITNFKSWQFLPNNKDFRLVSHTVSTITNEVCSNFFKEYIPESILCVHSNNTLTVGGYDHGSPVYLSSHLIGGGIDTLFGMFFTRPESVYDSTVLKFQSIERFVDWIQEILKPDSGLKGRPIFHKNLNKQKFRPFTTERPYPDPSPSAF